MTQLAPHSSMDRLLAMRRWSSTLLWSIENHPILVVSYHVNGVNNPAHLEILIYNNGGEK